ncbi:MAG: hypothetical protein KKF48_02805 [Nanoarchaeota archaeon]|nr:hypothetical protein [Nanoarchaeota archaeon]
MKIYELTTNGKDGYIKFLVRGVKNDTEAKRLAKRVFGKKFYWDSGISYYDDTTKSKGYKTTSGTKTMSKSQFLKYKKDFDRRQV